MESAWKLIHVIYIRCHFTTRLRSLFRTSNMPPHNPNASVWTPRSTWSECLRIETKGKFSLSNNYHTYREPSLFIYASRFLQPTSNPCQLPYPKIKKMNCDIVCLFVCLLAGSFMAKPYDSGFKKENIISTKSHSVSNVVMRACARVSLPILTSKPLKSWSNVWLDYIINITKCTWSACIFAEYTQETEFPTNEPVQPLRFPLHGKEAHNPFLEGTLQHSTDTKMCLCKRNNVQTLKKQDFSCELWVWVFATKTVLNVMNVLHWKRFWKLCDDSKANGVRAINSLPHTHTDLHTYNQIIWSVSIMRSQIISFVYR